MELTPGRSHSIVVHLSLKANWVTEGAKKPGWDFAPPSHIVLPVLYLPVKKQAGAETYPRIGLQATLFEKNTDALNYQVPALEGTEVRFAVRNIFPTGDRRPRQLELVGRLDRSLRTTVPLGAVTLRGWLDPSGPLRGRVNEVLLEFEATIPALINGGKPLQTRSSNRVFLYRRKTLVFLPGVFGSQFKVRTSKGPSAGFPVFSELKWQDISHLESDSCGVPLLDAVRPQLFSLNKPPFRISGLNVYDVLNKLRRARREHFPGVPDQPLLMELRIWAYDWRPDLAQTARQLLSDLRAIQTRLRAEDDTDDQIALLGHSTGGLLIRRLLADADQSLISHCFFLNVPFAGAPKALSVMLTGCETPGGPPMLPIVPAQSMMFVAPSAPIMYHLAPSVAYPEEWVRVPDPSDRNSPGARLMETAIRTGLYTTPSQVPPGGTADFRERTALHAREWREAQARLAPWSRALPLYRAARPDCAPFFGLPDAILWSPELEWQARVRIPLGWNIHLADAAAAFHEASARVALGGAWAAKAYVFYSTCGGDTTPGVLKIWRISEQRFTRAEDMLEHISAGAEAFRAGLARPVLREADRVVEIEGWERKRRKFLEAEEWAVDDATFVLRWWGLAHQSVAGDGTVPKVSLLAFGGPVHVFKPLSRNSERDEPKEALVVRGPGAPTGLPKKAPQPDGPSHVKAPNNEWLWTRVVRVLQGHDITCDLE